ncbi:MAG: NADPH-dependent stearoyl-CoA 9-desaturase [Chlamydiae bacterium]|nr:NADPH-dependent stearoyl-CoA 9-desaturase [Chlamydiota bacterium]
MPVVKDEPTFVSPYYTRNVKFARRVGDDFLAEARERVMAEFKHRGISTNANWEMKLKTLMVLTLYIGTVIAIYSNYFGIAGVLCFYVFMGFVSTLNGLNIAHDSLHGSYFKSPKLNRYLGYFFDFNSTSSFIWRVSHNTHHHIYTNIPGLDFDIDKGSILRFQPTDELRKFHYWQNWYVLPLYCISTINWAFNSDIVWFVRDYRKGTIPFMDAFRFFSFKAANLCFFVLIPMIILSVPWWVPLLGYIFLHMMAGITSAIVFQLAHLVEGVEFIVPNKEGELPYDWALHEMLTTSNFCTKSRWVTFWVGGLNFQIEHHLFPEICHVHYFWISDIVKETAEKYNFPYKEIPTFWGAVASHFRTLMKLGRQKNWT